jgi:hypothetical protein
MASVLQIAPPDAIRRIQRVQTVTIVWISVEALVSLFAAWRARSPALLAFGGDSAIELFSAVVVLWRFRASDAHEDVEKRTARVAGSLLFALAAYVAITSVASLLGYSEPKPTLLGIAILVAAAVVMPWLAREKRRLSGTTGSAALPQMLARALCKLGYEVAIKPINIHVWIPTVDQRWLILPRYTQPSSDTKLLIEKLRLQLPRQPPPCLTTPTESNEIEVQTLRWAAVCDGDLPITSTDSKALNYVRSSQLRKFG